MVSVIQFSAIIVVVYFVCDIIYASYENITSGLEFLYLIKCFDNIPNEHQSIENNKGTYWHDAINNVESILSTCRDGIDFIAVLQNLFYGSFDL